GAKVADAKVTLVVSDQTGKQVASVQAPAGTDGIYRSEPVPIPHRTAPGEWSITATANRAGVGGSASAKFQVKNSVSEELLAKYGFWVDEPSLGYMETSVGRERGDAENGDLIWGGFYVQMHVLKESHLEVYWRTGDFQLDSSAQVRKFLLDDVGNVGFIPLREFGEFKPVHFKQWDAWKAQVRGRLSQYDNQIMVFYAPEVNKTYAISTMVVLPPEGIDAHAVLRDGFEVHPELHANAKAPEPLVRLLPTPRLVSPAMGTRYIGSANEIMLKWEPVKTLAQDEYYRVKIDYDYAETNTSRYYTTRETSFRLPVELFSVPNCEVFNWQVTLMRQTGVGEDGQPIGEPISYDSLHWYVEWMYPSTDDAPFQTHCQNPQT
ncbi:MAG TPA: hypothetical protein VFH29_09690, partial [Anaerolineales bacterium]|nr:hypothetical protein [Anaerolineales bacterium]